MLIIGAPTSVNPAMYSGHWKGKVKSPNSIPDATTTSLKCQLNKNVKICFKENWAYFRWPGTEFSCYEKSCMYGNLGKLHYNGLGYGWWAHQYTKQNFKRHIDLAFVRSSSCCYRDSFTSLLEERGNLPCCVMYHMESVRHVSSDWARKADGSFCHCTYKLVRCIRIVRSSVPPFD